MYCVLTLNIYIIYIIFIIYRLVFVGYVQYFVTYSKSNYFKSHSTISIFEFSNTLTSSTLKGYVKLFFKLFEGYYNTLPHKKSSIKISLYDYVAIIIIFFFLY